MTWKDLVNKISEMTEEQQTDNITVYIQSQDEFFDFISLKITGENEDILDPYMFYLEVDA